jgi:enoyl-CoA hydratase/carnithine racemase
VIALACDMRIASREDARFGFVFPKVGLCGADMGAAYLLPRVVGLGRASRAAVLRATSSTPQEAYRIGLANRVVPKAEVLPTAQASGRCG